MFGKVKRWRRKAFQTNRISDLLITQLLLPTQLVLPGHYIISPVHNNQRDGNMTYEINPDPINYSPNSLNNNIPVPSKITPPAPDYTQGYIVRTPILKEDNFTQAGQRFRSLSPIEKEHLIDNVAVELYKCKKDIIQRVLANFAQADKEFAYGVEQEIKVYQNPPKDL